MNVLLGHGVARSTVDISTITSFHNYLQLCESAYRVMFKLVKIAMTIVVTTAECERSFSALKRVKNRLRTTMNQQRLADLAILTIEKEVADSINIDDILVEFASSDKNRRIVLS